MKKLASFLVDKRYIFAGITLALAVVCGILFPRVTIHTDMTRYLAKDSSMRKGMRIMEEQFGKDETSNRIRVMFTDLAQEQKDEVLRLLQGMEGVTAVQHDESELYNKDNHTLYVLQTSLEYGSKQEKALGKAIDKTFSQYDVIWKNNDTHTTEIPVWVIATALAILLAVLLAMSGSWFEPALFMLTVGVAVVLNLGSNILLGGISDVTFSVAALLQLILSMDYSIILTNRYRQERKQTDDKTVAMKNAVARSFVSVSGSAFTTVVGLVMLVFMRFRIGLDMGLVLAKGVLLSWVCVFTLLPSLMLLCDKLLQKTAKRRHKRPTAPASARPVVGEITQSTENARPVETAQASMQALQDTQTSVQTAQADVRPVQTVQADGRTPARSPRSFSGAAAKFSFKARYVLLGVFVALFVAVCFLQTKTPVRYTIGEKDKIQKVFASENPIVIVYRNEDEEQVHAFAQTLLDEGVVDGIAGYGDTVGAPYSAEEAALVLGGMGVERLDGAVLASVYNDYFAAAERVPLCELVRCLCADVIDAPAYANVFDETQKSVLRALRTQLDGGAAQLRGATHSRLTLYTHLPEESEQTTKLAERIDKTLKATLQYKHYMVGSSAMNYEMAKTFDDELLLITLLTIAAIFIVVAISFRNLLIPAMLVLLVQCGVYITVTALHSMGVYYLALLVVECILMGATIDYGILFANCYRENRAMFSPIEAAKRAYEGTLPTVFTSGLGLMLVTGVIGVATKGIISQMCFAVAVGTLSASVMILLVLPALLMLFDRPALHTLGRKKAKPAVKPET